MKRSAPRKALRPIDPSETHCVEKFTYASIVRPPPARWIAVELAAGIHDHGRPVEVAEVSVGFNNENVVGQRCGAAQAVYRIEQVIEDAEEQHYVELPAHLLG